MNNYEKNKKFCLAAVCNVILYLFFISFSKIIAKLDIWIY